jgi:hypothetical protein
MPGMLVMAGVLARDVAARHAVMRSILGGRMRCMMVVVVFVRRAT